MFVIILIALNFLMVPSVKADAFSEWAKYEKEVKDKYREHAKAQFDNWDTYKKRVIEKWNDGAIPEEKVYVEYFDNDLTRIKVDYENGVVEAETLQELKSANLEEAKSSIQKALVSVIDSNNSSSSILNQEEVSISKTSVAEEIDSFLKNTQDLAESKGSDNVAREHYKVTFKLVPNYIKLRAEKFRPTVEEWSKKYNLDPAFVLAIIRQESSFNPRARSQVGAIGLMQIMPKYAGKEVMQTVTGKTAEPDQETLYDPMKNIMFGTTYLQLLRDKHFPEIKDPEKSMYLMTASYNWGPERIKNSIKKGRLSTREPAASFFDQIIKIAPDETKGYLKKVREYKELFSHKDEI
jgi:membrane-bound lytic murein transglycosylase C